MRLNKYISETGICSRREADAWIAAGYEVMERMAAEFIPTVMSRGFHAGPVFGIFGAAIAAAKIQEVQKFLAATRHVYNPQTMAISEYPLPDAASRPRRPAARRGRRPPATLKRRLARALTGAISSKSRTPLPAPRC